MDLSKALDEGIDRVVPTILSNGLDFGMAGREQLVGHLNALVADLLARRSGKMGSERLLQALLTDFHGPGDIGGLDSFGKVVVDPVKGIGHEWIAHGVAVGARSDDQPFGRMSDDLLVLDQLGKFQQGSHHRGRQTALPNHIGVDAAEANR